MFYVYLSTYVFISYPSDTGLFVIPVLINKLLTFLKIRIKFLKTTIKLNVA